MHENKLSIACIQMQCGINAEKNIRDSIAYIRDAAQKKVNIVSLPETVNLMQRNKDKAREQVYEQHRDPGLRAYCDIAAALKIWLHVGSMVMLGESGSAKPFVNRGFMINPKGDITAIYDKLHMFDVELSRREVYRESDAFQSGESAVLAHTPWGDIGMSICYDLRFGYLYRALAQQGARLLLVPAAFTRTTGSKHWHILLRARAIECGAWVVATNQGGKHEDGRETYGHSLVVSPEGEVVMDAEMGLGVHVAELDLALSDEARRRIPSLWHDNVPRAVERL